MVVIAILAIVMTIGIPSIYRKSQKEDLTTAVKDMVEACSHARAQAILQGSITELRIHLQERRVDVAAAPAPTVPGVANTPMPDHGVPPPRPVSNRSVKPFAKSLPQSVAIEMCEVNFSPFTDLPEARVRFYPNGTSDEFTLVLRDDQGDWRKITLEVVTALANVDFLR